MKTILYATDGSESARKAGRFAAVLLEGWQQAKMVGLYVTQQIAFPYSVNFSEGDELREKRHVEQVRAQVCEEIFGGLKDGRVAFMHEEGRSPEVICDVAAEEEADLIVVGSHGYNFVDRVILGSVSHEVLHRSSVPVLIVPVSGSEAGSNGAAKPGLRRILFAADGSPETIVTAERVRELLQTWQDAEATVVYVRKAIQPYYRDHLSQAISDEEERWAKELEQTLTARVFSDLGDRVHFAKAEGSPSTEICRLAVEGNYDLVVVGSHGYRPSETFLYGSVSTAVAHHSKVPVLIVKPRRAVQEAVVGEALEEAIPVARTKERDYPAYPPLL